MERLCVRVQQQVCVLKGCEEGEEVQTARQILKEARDSRAVRRPLFTHCIMSSLSFGSLHILTAGTKLALAVYKRG